MTMKQAIQIRWHRPKPDEIDRDKTNRTERAATLALGFDQPATADNRLYEAQRELLFQVGVPVPVGEVTPREYAIELLKITAEVEHALMVQYLYAAASLDPALDVSPENYTVKVMRVAIQEMGHLATVQNLLLLTGGRQAIHLQRDVLRKSSELNAIPFLLEPVSLPALAKFVTVEMPARVPTTTIQKVAELLKIAKKDAGVEPHRVGAIYAVLRWLFLPKKEAEAWLDLTTIAGFPADFHLKDADLTPAEEMAALEAQIEEWDANLADFILETPRTCANAAEAITRVSEQGEGWNEAQDTHFAEFLELVEAFESGKLNAMIRPIAKSPTLQKGLGGEKGVLITQPYTKAWGEVFSLQYTLLVLSIYHALVTRRPTDGTPGLRGGLAELALRGMRRIIVPVAHILATLPLRKGKPKLSGPPYDLDPAVLEMADDIVLEARHLERLDRLAQLYAQIEADPEFSTHSGHNVAIANLRNFDQRRRKLFALPTE